MQEHEFLHKDDFLDRGTTLITSLNAITGLPVGFYSRLIGGFFPKPEVISL